MLLIRLALPLAGLLLAGPAFAPTLDQMAGQMIVVGFQGDSVSDKSVQAVRDEIAKSEIGGVMYLKPNVASRAAVIAINNAFKAASPTLLPFITLDQEGGAVERLTSSVGFKEIPNAETVAADNTPAQALPIYEQLARAVAQWGFNVNFAPVVDLNVNPNNQVIAKFGRAYGKTADAVVAYAGEVIEAHHDAGVLTAIKHFPGHGSSTADSHKGFVDITRTWTDQELDPYRDLIGKGFDDFVMVGHLIDRNVDPSGLPASLSPAWIDGVLRDKLGFKGVVVSDDLQMGAITDNFGLKQAVIDAVNAGVDVLLFSNTVKPRGTLGDEVRAIIVAEAEADPAFRIRVEDAYKRIVALKARLSTATASAG